MPRLSSLLPLPGMCDLETLAQDFVGRLKDADVEHDRRAALARRLKRLTENAKRLEGRGDLTSQLLELQQRFEAAETSGSRLDIRRAQRKLALWDELSTRLDETMEVNMLAEMGEVRHALSQISSTRERRVKVIESYDITDQVRIDGSRFSQALSGNFTCQPSAIRTSARAGRFGKLNVTYVSYVSESREGAHELVGKQLDEVSQVPHPNVAQLVGVTQGYHGFNGIVFVMDGMTWRDFDFTSHSGAVWAKYITGFEDFRKSYPQFKHVADIRVAPDGHLTVFPWGTIDQSFPTRPEGTEYTGFNDGEAMFYKTYTDNYPTVAPACLSVFVDAIAKLGVGFTRLQVMKLASSCGLFPQQESHSGGSYGDMLPFLPKAGEFAQLRYNESEIEGWKPLGLSYCFPGMIINQYSCPDPLTSRTTSPATEGHWFTHVLHNESQRDLASEDKSYGSWTCREQLRHVLWEDVFTEAQQLSQRLDIDLESIAFCHSVKLIARVSRPHSAHWDEIPVTIYYHWSPHSLDPREAKGFVSTRNIPDSGVWEDSLTQRGWEFILDWRMEYNKMSDDWGLRYDREIRESMAAMPGSYPGAHIEEVS